MVILFSEPLDPAATNDLTHYQIAGSTVTSADLKAGGSKLVLGVFVVVFALAEL